MGKKNWIAGGDQRAALRLALRKRRASMANLSSVTSTALRTSNYRSGSTKSWLKTKNPSAPGVRRFQDRE